MKIHDYLPATIGETVLVQGKVEKGLVQRTREQLKKNKIGWDEFFTAACMAYLEEPIRKVKGA